MSNLQRNVRLAHQSGAYAHGRIESLVNGRATVQVLCSSQRLTNLEVLNDLLSEGDYVIVDYSGGVPPVIRGYHFDFPDFDFPDIVFPSFEFDFPIPFDLTFEEQSYPSDVSFSVYNTQSQYITKEQDNYLEFDSVHFDEEGMLQSPTEIVIPYNGIYWFAVQAVFTAPDFGYSPNNSVYVFLESDRKGVFAHGRKMVGEFQASDEPLYVNTVGTVPALEGDIIRCRAFLDQDFYRNTLDLLVETGGDYENLSAALYGFRLGGGQVDAVTDASVSEALPESFDPSTIEIRDNEGFMYVLDTSSHTRAIANSQAIANQEVTLDYIWGDNDGSSNLSLFLRSSRDWNDWQTPTSGYELQIPNTGNWRIYKIQGGSRTLLDSKNFTAGLNWQSIRFQTNGTSVQAKIWTKGQSEPAGWDISLSDSDISSGGFQLGHFCLVGSHRLRIDNVDLHTP